MGQFGFRRPPEANQEANQEVNQEVKFEVNRKVNRGPVHAEDD